MASIWSYMELRLAGSKLLKPLTSVHGKLACLILCFRKDMS